MLPVVALVGKPNVGKSTIFNKLIGSRVAIIEDIPGVTRDRIYGEANFGDYNFKVIDTGGIHLDDERFTDEIQMQAEIAIEEANLVVFVVDGKEGLSQSDYLIRDMLRKSKKEVIVAINKIDSKKYQKHEYDFYELGFDEYLPVSGSSGSGFYEFLEAIVDKLPKKETKEDNRLKFSVVGRPNVGKSSIINALLNQERVIVSDVAGTTRDAIDTVLNYNKEEFVVIDTAGLRKKGKVFESVEKYSLLRSMKAIDRSDICLLVINAEEGIIEHDKHIAGYVLDSGKALIIVVNKWDLVDDNKKDFLKIIRAEFQFASFAPVVFVSAITKKGIHNIMPEVLKLEKTIDIEIKTSVLNEVISDAYQLNNPPSYKGKRLKIYYANQSGKRPPSFILHVNDKKLVHFSYERYLENKLRENFDLEGTPIRIIFKNRRDN